MLVSFSSCSYTSRYPLRKLLPTLKEHGLERSFRGIQVLPFTITVKINTNSSGHLVGDASVVSDCLDSHKLEATSNGTNVVMAGSDAAGDTVKGIVDSTGTVLSLPYIINGSPSGRCEIDDCAGTLGKR
jgi:hypothetical protein